MAQTEAQVKMPPKQEKSSNYKCDKQPGKQYKKKEKQSSLAATFVVLR